MKSNITYTATISPNFLHFSIWENDTEVDHHQAPITPDEYDKLNTGSLDSDSVTVPGWKLTELESDREHRHGVADRI